MLKLDRDKYFQILRSQGLSEALTALHRDQEKLEFETFEGQRGYQREAWNDLEQVREFSRELWNEALKDPNFRR